MRLHMFAPIVFGGIPSATVLALKGHGAFLAVGGLHVGVHSALGLQEKHLEGNQAWHSGTASVCLIVSGSSLKGKASLMASPWR